MEIEYFQDAPRINYARKSINEFLNERINLSQAKYKNEWLNSISRKSVPISPEPFTPVEG
jgi:hypothetical protein